MVRSRDYSIEINAFYDRLHNKYIATVAVRGGQTLSAEGATLSSALHKLASQISQYERNQQS